MIIFNSIEDLKQTVKINRNIPEESVAPFLSDAFDLYIRNFLGNTLADKLLVETLDDKTKALIEYVKRSLGPLALLLGADEMSIGIGDTGHTVTRTDNLAPASDSKIAGVKESLEFRAWNNTERMFDFLEENISDYPDWKESAYSGSRNNFFLNSAKEFQDLGNVNIEYRRLTYEAIKPAMAQMELRLRRFLSPVLFDSLKEKLKDAAGIYLRLINCSRIWIACNIAAIYTSQTTRVQRTQAARPEWKPKIYPLYDDLTDTGNFYKEQVALMEAEMTEIMNENADVLGIEKIEPLNWNDQDKKLFCDIG